MPTQRQLIRQDLQTALQLIVAGNAIPSTVGPGGTFKTTVKTVQSVPHTWTPTRMPPDMNPFIGVMRGPDRTQHLMYRGARRVWSFLLHCYVDGSDGNDVATKIDNLEDDIMATLSASPGLNGTDATNVTFVESMTDETDDPHTLYLKMVIDVLYWRAIDST